MDWKTHQESFTSQTIIKYMDPSDAQWKEILDHMLFRDKRGRLTHPEGRKLMIMKLPAGEKLKLLHRLPKKAKYMRKAIRDFWSLNLEPANEIKDRIIGGESIWYNHSFEIKIDWRTRNYLRDVLQIVVTSDIMDKDTNRVFKKDDWIDWIEELHKNKYGDEISGADLHTTLDAIKNVIRQVPQAAKQKMREQLAYKPKIKELVALVSTDGSFEYGYCKGHKNKKLAIAWIDSTGTPRETNKIIKTTGKEIHKVQMWEAKKGDLRVYGPIQDAFPANTKWRMKGSREEFELWKLTIKLNTSIRQSAKMKPPPAQENWEVKLQRILIRFKKNELPWSKIWRLSPMYVTPRDTLTWIKVKHRNLYVAKHDNSVENQKCLACDDELEGMLHLVECEKIREDYWFHIISLMSDLGLNPPSEQDELELFLLFGMKGEDKVYDRETAGMIALAWRCLYAEIVKSRIEDKELELTKHALTRFAKMLKSRVTAYGVRWRRWYMRTSRTTRFKLVPKRHQKYKLIAVNKNAEYKVSEEIEKFLERINELTTD